MSTRTNILAIEKDNDRTSSSTSTTTRTRAREIMAFAARNGLKPTPMMEDWMENLIKGGSIEPEVLKEVVIETMYAPQPSWRYYAAIIRRLLRETPPYTCFTLDKWAERQDRWNSGY